MKQEMRQKLKPEDLEKRRAQEELLRSVVAKMPVL
jgi:hypothetical protein